ncbi:hypothetical protein ACVOMV_33845 [Mesorhizobium atlanticum]
MPKYFNAGIGTKVTPPYGMNEASQHQLQHDRDHAAHRCIDHRRRNVGQDGDRCHGRQRRHQCAGRHGLGLENSLQQQLRSTEGRAENEKGNDKVLIVLTDGANTYYTPTFIGSQ